MAAEVEKWSLSERIDAYLTEVTAAWATVPDDAAEWDEWDEESRLVYRFGWTNPRDAWHDLKQWVAEGHLTPEQQCRFEQIERLMEANGDTLARLLDSESDRDASKHSRTKRATS
jgi:hypothetical protein